MFEHKLIDGDKIRVLEISSTFLKPEILEMREPTVGATSEQACRTQYAVAGETLVERYLPPEPKGESWSHDGAAPPWWQVVGHPPHGGVVAAFNKQHGGAYHRTLNTDENVVAYTENGESVFFGNGEYRLTRASDATEIRAPQIEAARLAYYE